MEVWNLQMEKSVPRADHAKNRMGARRPVFRSSPFDSDGRFSGRSCQSAFFVVYYKGGGTEKWKEQGMPIFEYVCKTCGKEFEKLVPSAQTKASCPECSGEQVVKKLSRFAAAVKESGGCPSKEFCPSASSGCGCGHGGCCHHH